MKKIQLTSEEKEIMDAIERDEFVPISGRKLKNIADSIAARKKDTTSTIRVNRNDIMRKEYDFSKSIKNPYA